MSFFLHLNSLSCSGPLPSHNQAILAEATLKRCVHDKSAATHCVVNTVYEILRHGLRERKSRLAVFAAPKVFQDRLKMFDVDMNSEFVA